MSKEPEQLYHEREKRIEDTIALIKPDKVPVLGGFGSFPVRYANISFEEEANDIDKCLEANFKTMVDFQPDVAFLQSAIMGAVIGPVGYRQAKWAGHGLSSDAGFQFVEGKEGEYMKAEEYDELIYDPSDFVVRRYWARAYEKLGIFGALAPLREGIGYHAGPFAFMAFGMPGAAEALDALKKAGEAAVKAMASVVAYIERLKAAGFPLMFVGATLPPFDFIGDFLRGRKGSMLDMYRRPEKVIAAAEKLLPMAIEMGARGAKMSGNPRVFIAIHGGIESFMSVEQYKKFYWPGLRGLIMGLINEGLNPVVWMEGGSDSRLPIIKDVPQGKVCYIFENVDMAKAKEVLGGIACIGGNVPTSLLATGSPEQVKAYCKRLIDTAGRDGGYVMSAGGGMDDARPENVRAMIEFTNEYGVY